MLNLELWLMDLLRTIKNAADNGENFDLHLENEAVQEIAEAFDKSEWIEIY